MRSELAPLVPQRLLRIYGRMDYEPTNSHSYSWYIQNDQLAVCSHLTQTLADAAEDRAHQRIFVSHQISAPRDISQAMRNQFNSPTKGGTETTNDELDVQVQIEQAVMVDYDPVYGRESYRKPRVIWDKKQGATKGDKLSPTEQNQWELASAKSIAEATDAV
jgi:hypothetical protein